MPLLTYRHRFAIVKYMERTTIYLEEKLKDILLELSYKESKKKRKRIGMAEIIRMVRWSGLSRPLYSKREMS